MGKYMRRPLLSLERLFLDEKEGKVCYRYGENEEEAERMDYLKFIARVTSHIPEKGRLRCVIRGCMPRPIGERCERHNPTNIP